MDSGSAREDVGWHEKMAKSRGGETGRARMEKKIISDLGAGLAPGPRGQIYFSFAKLFSRGLNL
jgi:hypothetical protein